MQKKPRLLPIHLIPWTQAPQRFPDREQVSSLHEEPEVQRIVCQVQGMHCASCAIVIERGLKQLSSVREVRVNVRTEKAVLHCSKPLSLQELQQTVQENGYTILPWRDQQEGKRGVEQHNGVRDAAELVIITLLLLGIFWLLAHLPLVPHSFGISVHMSYGVVFVLGLIASISSCMAATSGLLLGVTVTGHSQHVSTPRFAKFQIPLLFSLGRVVSYTTFGAVIGAIGSLLTLSSQLNGVIMILASLAMLLLGLYLLQFIPWLRMLQPRLPQFLARMLIDTNGTSSKRASFLMGTATFFLPCGFTQALQVYVLSRGSAVTGALTMLLFALGTLPALLSFGALSGLFTGWAQRYVIKVSGVLVLLIGLLSMQSGLVLTGVSLPSLNTLWQRDTVSSQGSHVAPIVAGKQVVSMKIIGLSYVPSTFTVVQGIPVAWQVDGSQAEGCARVLTLPDLGLTKALSAQGSTTIEFVPQQSGVLRFRCPAAMTTADARFLVVPQTHQGGGTQQKIGISEYGSVVVDSSWLQTRCQALPPTRNAHTQRSSQNTIT